MILFHLYTPAFNSYRWRMQLGQFYARKMQSTLPFVYILLDRRRNTDVTETFQEVTSILELRIRSEFGPHNASMDDG